MAKKKPNPFRARATEDEKKLDTTPIEMPVGFSTPTPLQDLIASMVKEAVEQERGDQFETIEESDDFEADDEDLLDFSPYELDELTEELPITLEAESPQTPPEAPQETIRPTEGDTPEQVE